MHIYLEETSRNDVDDLWVDSMQARFGVLLSLVHIPPESLAHPAFQLTK